MKKHKIGIIGAGKVGVALGCLLKERGYQLVGISSRTSASAERGAAFIGTVAYLDPVELASLADCLFLTTPDGEIVRAAEYLVDQGVVKEGKIVVHLSGALPAEILSFVKEKGAAIFSLHPLQTFADVQVAMANLPGSFFAAQGDKEVFPLMAELVADLGGEMVPIDKESKALYHAGACVACNYLVSLVDMALNIYQKIGISRERSLQALLPLIKGTVANLENVGIPQALTGPIARGDGAIIANHLVALENLAPELKELYSGLGIYTVSVGEAKGTLGQEKGEEIKKILGKG